MDQEGIRILKSALLLMLLMFVAIPPAQAQQIVPTAQTFAKKPPEPEAPRVRTSGVFDGVTVFRNIIFGLGREDVRRLEKAVAYKEDDTSLYYVYQPDEFRRTIRYDFEDDKLVRIHHSVVELHFPHLGRVVEMYYDVQNRMSELYGEPAGMELFWKNKRYEKYPDYWGRALFSGDLRMVTRWTPPGVTITLDCYHDGNDYHFYYTLEPVQAGAASRNAIDLQQQPTP